MSLLYLPSKAPGTARCLWTFQPYPSYEWHSHNAGIVPNYKVSIIFPLYRADIVRGTAVIKQGLNLRLTLLKWERLDFICVIGNIQILRLLSVETRHDCEAHCASGRFMNLDQFMFPKRVAGRKKLRNNKIIGALDTDDEIITYLLLIQERLTRIRDTSGMMLWVPQHPVFNGPFVFFWKIIVGGAGIGKLHWSCPVRNGENIIVIRHGCAPRCFLPFP